VIAAGGANSDSEFATQIGKIVKALTEIGADVMTISELENNYYGNK
jgi:predicted extracellular nuclease